MEVRRKHTREHGESEEERGGAQLRLLSGPQTEPTPRGRRGRIDLPVPWQLDPATRERGLVGVERARRALEATHPPEQHLPRAS